MSGFDITVAVTAKSESIVAGPPMRSAERAIALAEAEGFCVERLIGLDAPTDECRSFFSQPALSHWITTEYALHDPYPVRNALVERASGRWIAFLDADDLFSENWLVEAARRLAKAEKADERIIVHPEINWVFDNSPSVYTKPNQDDPLFLPHYWYFVNYYDMMCMAPRKAHLAVPYVNRDLANGFGYGDWQWNIEIMAAGWTHVVAKDTLIFKRRRDSSVVLENAARQTILYDIEPLAIDRVSSLADSAKRTSDMIS